MASKHDASGSDDAMQVRARPMCGLMRHYAGDSIADGPPPEGDDCSLEFFYITPRDVWPDEDSFDFSVLYRRLEAVASRGRQAVVRLSACTDYVDPSCWLQLPDWMLKRLRKAKGTETFTGKKFKAEYALWGPGKVGQDYEWWFHKFIRHAALRLDRDPRVAFVQGFVGHWAEGHLSCGLDEEKKEKGPGPAKVGDTGNTKTSYFPNACQYKDLLDTVARAFTQVRWMIGISAGDSNYRRDCMSTRAVLPLQVGTFEDTFMDVNKKTVEWNNALLNNLGSDRWRTAPRGGEISHSGESQTAALCDVARDQALVRERHMTFALAHPRMWAGGGDGKDSAKRAAVSSSFGYRFRVGLRSCPPNEHDGSVTVYVAVENCGVAPIYYPTFVWVGGDDAGGDDFVKLVEFDLQLLQPGHWRTLRCVLPRGVVAVGSPAVVLLRCRRCLRAQGCLPFERNVSEAAAAALGAGQLS